MQVMVDEQSSTILTAGHPAAIGGTVTMETYHIGKVTNYCRYTHTLTIPILNSQLIRELCECVSVFGLPPLCVLCNITPTIHWALKLSIVIHCLLLTTHHY